MKPLTLNLLWVIGLLLSVICAFAVISPSGELLKEYVTFSAAVASILLALVAIFYAFVSNGSMSSTMHEVRQAASSLVDETQRLNAASSGLSDEAEEIIRRLENLPESVTQIRGELSKKIDDLATTRKSDSDEKGLPQKGYSVSIGYKAAMYLLARAVKSRKTFTVYDIFKDMNPAGASEYVSGVIEVVRVHCVANTKIDGIEGKYFISRGGDLASEKIIEDMVSDLREDPHEILQTMVEHIDQYFTQLTGSIERTEGDETDDKDCLENEEAALAD